MHSDRFDHFVWVLLAALLAAIVAVVSIGDRVGARVAGIVPADGAQVGPFTKIEVAFGQPMVAASLDGLLKLEPELPGATAWEMDTLRFTPQLPLVSGSSYQVRLLPGARSVAGRSVLRATSSSFTVRNSKVLYLSPANPPHEIFSKDVGADASAGVQLTRTNGAIYDYAVARDGGQVVYSAQNARTGVDLWLIARSGGTPRLLVSCEIDRCIAPEWAPDGRRIAYSRENAGVAPGAAPGAPRLWTVDAETGETAAFNQDMQVLGFDATWSPDGKRLMVYDGSELALRVYEVESGRQQVVQTQMGMVGSWSPDGTRMVITDLKLAQSQALVTLHLIDFERKDVSAAIGPEPESNDYSTPAWSPAGDWLLTAKRLPGSGPNKQLWLMRLDGSEGRALSSDNDYTYDGYRWDAWGTQAVMQRIALREAGALPEVVVWTMGSSAVRLLVADASMARWLP